MQFWKNFGNYRSFIHAHTLLVFWVRYLIFVIGQMDPCDGQRWHPYLTAGAGWRCISLNNGDFLRFIIHGILGLQVVEPFKGALTILSKICIYRAKVTNVDTSLFAMMLEHIRCRYLRNLELSPKYFSWYLTWGCGQWWIQVKLRRPVLWNRYSLDFQNFFPLLFSDYCATMVCSEHLEGCKMEQSSATFGFHACGL